MTEKNDPEFRQNREEWDKAKAESFSFGGQRKHRDLESHENEFDASYQEWQYQEAAKKLEKSGKVEIITIDEPGCERMVAYKIGEPTFVINAHLHGDEPGPAIPMFIQLVDRIIEGDPRINNVLIIPRCNEEAYKQLERGVLLDEELWSRLVVPQAGVFLESEKEKILTNEKVDQNKFQDLLEGKGFHVSLDEAEEEGEEDVLYLDLNRQFPETANFQQPDVNTLFPKARQLLRMMNDHAPKAKEGFSFHSDNSLPEPDDLRGCYVYDTCKVFPENAPDQETEHFVKNCVDEFRKKMNEAGIRLLTGIDDDDDELLGKNPVEDGYCCTPATEKKKDGVIVPRPKALHDKTFETGLVRWRMDRFWSFETAGWINIDKRAEMIKILLDTIVLPIMGRAELPPEPTPVVLPKPDEQLKAA